MMLLTKINAPSLGPISDGRGGDHAGGFGCSCTRQSGACNSARPLLVRAADTAASDQTAKDSSLPKPGDVTREDAARILNAQLDSINNRPQDQRGLRFNFTGTKWEDVFEWFCDQADLSQQFDQYPPGSVNFSDPTRTYSIAETQDLLNRLLLDRGYALVRRGRMLFLIDLQMPNAANYISEMAELVTLGRVGQTRGVATS